jgi:hypothetical protein
LGQNLIQVVGASLKLGKLSFRVYFQSEVEGKSGSFLIDAFESNLTIKLGEDHFGDA